MITQPKLSGKPGQAPLFVCVSVREPVEPPTARRIMTKRIVAVEDDPFAREVVEATFEGTEYEVVHTATIGEAESALQSHPIDVVLLDVNLPDGSGLELLNRLRRESEVPVLMVSGLGETADRVVGLRLGADDYIVKPVEPVELRARVEAVLRRSRSRGPVTSEQCFGSLSLDPQAREVRVDGNVVDLTPREYDLLAFLAAHPRQVFSRKQLLEQVWEVSPEWHSHATVTEHIRRMRTKLARYAGGRTWVTTVRRVGYRFDPQ